MVCLPEMHKVWVIKPAPRECTAGPSHMVLSRKGVTISRMIKARLVASPSGLKDFT